MHTNIYKFCQSTMWHTTEQNACTMKLQTGDSDFDHYNCLKKKNIKIESGPVKESWTIT